MGFENFSDQDLLVLQQALQQQQHKPQTTSAPTIFKEDYYDNIIKWQLDIKEELQRIEHLLRKHVPKVEGNTIIYVDPKPEDQLFNETGINEILNLLAWYLNKNVILSNFALDEVKLRCWQFHRYLTDFIFNNYQKFGLDSKEKIKHYPMVVMNITNTIEASYLRALNGGERESLRTARMVQQTEQLGMNMPMNMQQQKKQSIWKPWTWGKG